MSIVIRKKTYYFKLNSKGFFKPNTVTFGRKSTIWNEPVQKGIDLIKDHYGGEIISIYLRGSVANNTQIKGISDIDLVVITSRNISSSRKSFLQKELGLLKKNYNFFTKFDVMYIDISDVANSPYRALIKLASKCVYGKDIKNLIPDLKPGIDIAVTLPSIESEVEEMILNKKFVNPQETCIWIMKRILRSGAELVSERSGLYARDLYSCYKVFSVFYPKYKNQMYLCLEKALSPSNDTEEIKEIIIDVSKFIISESKYYRIIKNNPKVGAVLRGS